MTDNMDKDSVKDLHSEDFEELSKQKWESYGRIFATIRKKMEQGPDSENTPLVVDKEDFKNFKELIEKEMFGSAKILEDILKELEQSPNPEDRELVENKYAKLLFSRAHAANNAIFELAEIVSNLKVVEPKKEDQAEDGNAENRSELQNSEPTLTE